MMNNLYTLNYEQISKLKALRKIVSKNKDILSDYELLIIKDIIHFISNGKIALTSNSKLIKLFKLFGIEMKQHELDENIYIIYKGDC